MPTQPVLIAVAHAAMRESLRGLLSESCGAVLAVGDRASLLEAVEKTQPRLIVLDLTVADLARQNLVRECRRRRPEVKVIVLTAYDEPEGVEELLASGAAGVVLLSTAARSILPAVRAAARGEVYFSPGIARKGAADPGEPDPDRPPHT